MNKATSDENEKIESLIESFKRNCILCDQAREDEDNKAQRKYGKGYADAVRALEALVPNGRDLLIPLLDDPSYAVRVYAAAYLVRSMPERALAVLEHISTFCITRTHMTAYHMLSSYKRGEWHF